MELWGKGEVQFGEFVDSAEFLLDVADAGAVSLFCGLGCWGLYKRAGLPGVC
jgi:hypothetical protein